MEIQKTPRWRHLYPSDVLTGQKYFSFPFSYSFPLILSSFLSPLFLSSSLPFSLPLPQDMKKHLKESHGITQTFICFICYRGFLAGTLYHKHWDEFHDRSCRFCYVTLPTLEDLKDHLIVVHQKVYDLVLNACGRSARPSGSASASRASNS